MHKRPAADGALEVTTTGQVASSIPPATPIEIDPERDDIAAQLRRRRAAALRLPPLPSGYRDPLDELAARR